MGFSFLIALAGVEVFFPFASLRIPEGCVDRGEKPWRRRGVARAGEKDNRGYQAGNAW
jgi:hypothetical protein